MTPLSYHLLNLSLIALETMRLLVQISSSDNHVLLRWVMIPNGNISCFPLKNDNSNWVFKFALLSVSEVFAIIPIRSISCSLYSTPSCRDILYCLLFSKMIQLSCLTRFVHKTRVVLTSRLHLCKINVIDLTHRTLELHLVTLSPP